MQKKLLTTLIKSKLRKSKTTDQLIDEFVKLHTDAANKHLEEFLSDLFIYINQNLDTIAKDDLLEIVTSKLQDLNIVFDTKDVETIYQSIATATSVGSTKVVFDKVDLKAIDAMRKGFYWAADQYNGNTQELLKETIESAFKGDLQRAEISSILKEKFGDIAGKSESYYKLVSDNIISQAQNVSRVNQALKYDVKTFKVKARIDNKTSDFCRSINGKIIISSHLENQITHLLEAKSIDDKKAASQWVSKPIYGKLPANVGLPPYHGHCRTIVEPAWISETEKIDPKTKKKYTVKNSSVSKQYALQHIDKTGIEVKVEHGVYDKIIKHKHGLTEKQLVGALNDIKYKAPHKITGEHPNEHIRTVALTGSGYTLVYEADKLITCFPPGRRVRGYFNDNAILGKVEDIDTGKITERVKKWYENLI